ncbi:MAG: OmpA family protein [Dysgonamonadaceae bacterium]|jgi:outer membrane protein OmpA-like peptidoglycan-associated protein|nr:OmpA family protein [Dysgonamonadaceae bacterium]
MKKVVMIILAMIPLLCTEAQEVFTATNQTKEEAAIKTTFLATRIVPDNWFISLGIGAADLMSEESRYVPFMDRAKPMLALSIGKWVSPVWGLRLNVTGSRLQGFATWTYDAATGADYGFADWYVGTNHSIPGHLPTNSYVSVYNNPNHASYIRQIYLDRPRNTNEGFGYEYDLAYVGASADFLLNVNNIFRPYRSDRPFELVLIAGLAYAHTLKDANHTATNIADEHDDSSHDVTADRSAVNVVGLKAGLQAKFQVSPRWDLFLEGHSYILPEMFDHRVGDGNTMDGVGNYMIGVTYNLSKANRFEKPQLADAALIEKLNNKINELQSRPPVVKQDCPEEVKALKGQLADLEKQIKERPKAVAREKLKVVVHFLIDRHNVRPSEMYKLEEIAAFMQKYPQVKVSVSGYADVKTAYPEYNLKLSDRRAREVVRVLTSKFGIDQSRFVVKAFGDTVQPFSINNLNRAVIAFDIE